MKSCPSCQQVYTDEGPDYCLNDGTLLVKSASAYNPGAAYAGQWQQPAQGWQPPPQGFGYPPPAQYPPYGQSGAGGAGLSKAALFTGLGSFATLLIVFLIGATASRTRDTAAFAGIIFLLSLIAGLTAIVLGIVSLSMAGRNPAVGKARGVIGLVLGVIPIILLLLSLMFAGRRF